MMLSDELNDGVYDLRRHWHGFDKIAAGIGESLSFGRISRYGQNLIWSLRGNRTQGNPQCGRAGSEVVAIIRGLGPVQFDHGVTCKEQVRFCSRIQWRPGRG